jgi:DTW domain-containing protein
MIRAHRAHRCEGCRLPAGCCVCAELPRARAATRVVLVMHHVETRRTSNTGRIAARVLGAEIRLRGERGAAPRPPLPEGRRLLLFPAHGARILSRSDAAPGPPVLVVPDGNWRQASRMLHRDEDAKDAQIVALPPGAPSRYLLRQGSCEESLCTLEAIARALGILEGPEIEGLLMRALDLFVSRTLALRGGLSRQAEP